MAYKTLIQASKAQLLDKKNAQIEGYLIDAQTRIGKFKSTIYTFDTKNGPLKVWGNRSTDSVLLDEKGKGLNPELMNVKVRVTCTDVRTERKGKQTKTYRDYRVEADVNDKRGGKNYNLKRG